MTNVTGTFAACDDASCFQSNLSGQDTSGGTTNNIAVAILSSLLAIVIFIGNGLIIVSVCLVRKLRQPANYLIVSLALSDFLVAVIVLPLTIVYEILQEWVFGNTICNIHISVDVICCATSILNLVMISIDRYLMIARPFWYPKKRNSTLMCTMIACVWILACLIIFPAMFGFAKNVTDDPGWINFTLTDQFHYDSAKPKDAAIGKETILSWTPCVSGERVWQATADLKKEHNVTDIIGKTISDSDVKITILLIREGTNATARRDLLLSPSATVKTNSSIARFIRIFMDDTQQKHFANTSLDVHADAISGKQCLISQEKWFTVYSTMSSFYIPGAVMLFMYYKIYLEASRLAARQRARSLSDGEQNVFVFTRHSTKVKIAKRAKHEISVDGSSSDLFDINPGPHHRRTSVQTGSSRAQEQNEQPSSQQRGNDAAKSTSRDNDACPASPPIVENDSQCLILPSREVNGNFKENCDDQRRRKSWCKNLRYSTSSLSQSEGSGLIRRPSREKHRRGERGTNPEEPARAGRYVSRPGRSILSARRKSYRRPFASSKHQRKSSTFLRRNFLVQREKMGNVKATRTLGIVVLVFMFCWLPFFVVTFIRPFLCNNPESPDCIPQWLVRLVLWLGYLNSAMNPIIYIGFNGELRDTFRLLLLCKCLNVDRHLARGEMRRAIEHEKKHNASVW